MKKYKTGGYVSRGCSPITIVEVVKETAYFATVAYTDSSGKPRTTSLKKDSGYKQFHDTWEDARNHLIEKAEASLAYAREKVEACEKKLADMQALPASPPEEQG